MLDPYRLTGFHSMVSVPFSNTQKIPHTHARTFQSKTKILIQNLVLLSWHCDANRLQSTKWVLLLFSSQSRSLLQLHLSSFFIVVVVFAFIVGIVAGVVGIGLLWQLNKRFCKTAINTPKPFHFRQLGFPHDLLELIEE